MKQKEEKAKLRNQMKQEILDLLDHPEEIFRTEERKDTRLLLSKKQRDVRQEEQDQQKLKSFFARVYDEFLDHLHYHIIDRLDYKFYWTLYYVLSCLFVGAIIASVDNLNFIDGLFMAVSAMTGSGLSTVGMYQLSTTSFGFMALLMLCGCSPFMLMVLIFFRRRGFACAMARVDELRKQSKPYWKKNIKKDSSPTPYYNDGKNEKQPLIVPPYSQLTAEEKYVIEECFLLDEALGVLLDIALGYYLTILILGGSFLLAALKLRPLAAELVARKATYEDNAFFLTAAAFGNVGLTLTSDNLIGLADNPPAYLILVVFILAGNSALPIFLRNIVAGVLWLETNVVAQWYPNYVPVEDDDTNTNTADDSAHKDGDNSKKKRKKHTVVTGQVKESPRAHYRRVLQFILDHPHRLTTYMFSSIQTKVLGLLILLLVIIQYFFFLASTMTRKSALSTIPPLKLAGIGFFQTMSTRSAGFAMMDLRQLNQGLILIYMIMMYISAFPFIATLQKSREEEEKAQLLELEERRAKLAAISGDENITEDFVMSPLQELTLSNPSSSDFPETPSPRKKSSSFATSGSAKLKVAQKKEEEKDKHIHRKFLGTFLLRHTFFLFLAVLVCAFSEDRLLSVPDSDDVNLFYVAFEIISAYGNVGLSLGIPGQVYSLSGAMSITGKFTIIIIMWLGKHRGLASPNDEVADFKWEKYLRACRAIETEEEDSEESLDSRDYGDYDDKDKNHHSGDVLGTSSKEKHSNNSYLDDGVL